MRFSRIRPAAALSGSQLFGTFLLQVMGTQRRNSWQESESVNSCRAPEREILDHNGVDERLCWTHRYCICCFLLGASQPGLNWTPQHVWNPQKCLDGLTDHGTFELHLLRS